MLTQVWNNESEQQPNIKMQIGGGGEIIDFPVGLGGSNGKCVVQKYHYGTGV